MVFNSMLETVKNTTVVKSGFEVFSIAREVYNIVNEDTDVPEKKAEQIYLQAASRVTKQPEPELQQRVDYKLVRQTSRTVRTATNNVRAARRRLREKTTALRKETIARFRELVELLKEKMAIVKERVNESGLWESERLKTVISNLKTAKQTVLVYSQLVYKQVDEFVDFESCYKQADELSEKCLDLYKRVKEVSVEGKNTIVDICSKNASSLSETVYYNYEYAKKSVSTDFGSFKEALQANRELFLAYVKNLDLEMYYSPEKSFKLVESLRAMMVMTVNTIRKQIEAVYPNCEQKSKEE